MKRINSIVVPVDFTDCSINAVKYAINMSRFLQADVRVISVEEPIVTPGEYGNVAVTTVKSKQERYDSLDTLMKSLSEGVLETEKITWDVLEGEVISSVTGYADEYGADLIVVGTMGASGWFEKKIGSNASLIAEDATCPVLIIPSDFTFTEMNKAIMAYDYKEVMTESELLVLVDLLIGLDIELELLKVVVQKQEVTAEEAEAVRNLDGFLHDKNVQFKYAHIMCDDVVKGLSHRLDKGGVDLMVVMPQKHNFIERLFKKRVSKEIMVQPKTPVLVIHDAIEA